MDRIGINFGIVLLCALLVNHAALPITDSESESYEESAVADIVVAGLDALKHQFPYQVSLQRNELFSFDHNCGGSIITPSFVVTAAHCIDEFSPNDMRVVAGLLKLDAVSHKGVQISEVNQTFVHPYYNRRALMGVSPNDIALVQVATLFRFTKAVQPILLPNPGDEPKGTVELSGWGAISDGILPEYPNRLQHVTLKIINFDECKHAVNDTLDWNRTRGQLVHVTQSMVCTQSFSGHASGCFGDSGGPIQQNNHLIGIASWVVTPCGKFRAPTMYTKTSYFIYFIREIVSRHSNDVL